MTQRIVVAVCGFKNSGKTTFLTHVIPLLLAKGLRVAVVKHAEHHHTFDKEGTDTWRLREAGACGVAVFDGRQFLVLREGNPSPNDLACMFPDADVVLMEGGKKAHIGKSK